MTALDYRILVKWDLNEFIKGGNMNHKSCEMMAREILEHLKNKWGADRWISVTVSEDGESDGTVTWSPKAPQKVPNWRDEGEGNTVKVCHQNDERYQFKLF